jgi:hypothetical protein
LEPRSTGWFLIDQYTQLIWIEWTNVTSQFFHITIVDLQPAKWCQLAKAFKWVSFYHINDNRFYTISTCWGLLHSPLLKVRISQHETWDNGVLIQQRIYPKCEKHSSVCQERDLWCLAFGESQPYATSLPHSKLIGHQVEIHIQSPMGEGV